MKTNLGILLAGMAFVTAANYAVAQEMGDAKMGFAFAERVCAECHAVRAGEIKSPFASPELSKRRQYVGNDLHGAAGLVSEPPSLNAKSRLQSLTKFLGVVGTAGDKPVESLRRPGL